jgi:hypothetical protein
VLCSNVCSCGIYSNSLIISGSGGQGDPWQIETNAFQVVTSSTRPAGPVAGQSIYETDTKRYVVYDGTNWVIMAGQMPGCTAYTTGGAQSSTNAVIADASLVSETYDIGGFHTGTNAFFTVPAGMAGDYAMAGWVKFGPAGVAGQRTVLLALTSNGSQVNPLPRSTNYPSVNTANSGVTITSTLRLVAGAVLTLQGYQDSGTSAGLTDAILSLDMIRHIPSLT